MGVRNNTSICILVNDIICKTEYHTTENQKWMKSEGYIQ